MADTCPCCAGRLSYRFRFCTIAALRCVACGTWFRQVVPVAALPRIDAR